jgi:hypothetical protein
MIDKRIQQYNRRQVLAGSAAVAAGTVMAGTDEVARAAARANVVLHDSALAMDPAVAMRLRANGARVIEIGDDPVRLWRSEIGALLAHRDTRLFGVTRWADLLIVRGLAAESRRHVRFERQHRDTGTFTWLIA